MGAKGESFGEEGSEDDDDSQEQGGDEEQAEGSDDEEMEEVDDVDELIEADDEFDGEGEDEDDDDGDDDRGEDDEEEEEEKAVTGAGMGEAIAKILSTKVGSGGAVLAKRKTPLMKELEARDGQAEVTKKRRLEKAAMRNVGVTVPDDSTLNHERHLKKIATRAVVALFNAISKHQNAKADSDEEDEGGKRKRKRTALEREQLLKTAALKSVRDASSAAYVALNKDDTTSKKTKKPTGGFSTDWARDDFLLDSKVDDWGDDDEKPKANGKKKFEGVSAFLHNHKDKN